MDKILSNLLLLLTLMFSFAACSGGGDAPGPANVADVLFADEFSSIDSRLWDTEQDNQGSTTIQNGQMVIAIQTLNTIQFTTLKEPVFDDFLLKVDVTMLEGSPESSMGILFRMQDANRFYRFDMMADGRFMVERRNGDGTWTRFLNDWTFSSAIFAGLNNTNRLKIIARDSQMAFFANEELLLEINDSTYMAGQLALDAGTFGHAPFRVAFDNLVVTQP